MDLIVVTPETNQVSYVFLAVGDSRLLTRRKCAHDISGVVTFLRLGVGQTKVGDAEELVQFLEVLDER